MVDKNSITVCLSFIPEKRDIRILVYQCGLFGVYMKCYVCAQRLAVSYLNYFIFCSNLLEQYEAKTVPNVAIEQRKHKKKLHARMCKTMACLHAIHILILPFWLYALFFICSLVFTRIHITVYIVYALQSIVVAVILA